MPQFVRPESLAFPTTYREFFTSKDGNEIRFRIKEIPEEFYDETVDLVEKYFFTEETIQVSKKIAESAEKREYYRKFYRGALNAKLSIGCFNEDTGELVAINVMAVSSKDDEKRHVSD